MWQEDGRNISGRSLRGARKRDSSLFAEKRAPASALEWHETRPAGAVGNAGKRC